MTQYWERINKAHAEDFGITCDLPPEPIIFYKDGSWVPIKKAGTKQLTRHRDFLHANGYIGGDERARAWSFPAPQGEIACDMWEASLEQMEDLCTHPLIDAIDKELKERLHG